MQASGALGHCVSVIPIMPPSHLNTAFSCSCTWSWLRTVSTFAFLWINMQMDIFTDIYRHLHEVSHMYGGQPIGIILWKWSIVKKHPVSTCMSKFAPPPPPPHPPPPPTPPPPPHPPTPLSQAYQLLTIICLFLPSVTKLIWACLFINFSVVFEAHVILIKRNHQEYSQSLVDK